MMRLIYMMAFLLCSMAGMAQTSTELQPDTTGIQTEVTVQIAPETGHIRFKSGNGWTEWYKMVPAIRKTPIKGDTTGRFFMSPNGTWGAPTITHPIAEIKEEETK